LSALRYAQKKKRPLVVTYHGDAQANWGSMARRASVAVYNRFILDKVLSYARVIISPSEHFVGQSRFLRKYRDKVVVIPNGIALSDFDLPYSKKQSRRKLALPDGENIILFVGALSPYKGPGILLSALPEILTSVPNAILILVGDGPLKETLERETKKLGLDGRVLFPGFVESTYQKALFYYSADVFVLPSTTTQESFGIVNLEAMACGLPIVASRIGGIPSVVKDGECGLLVPAKDPPALAEAVIRLLQNEGLRSRMIRCG